MENQWIYYCSIFSGGVVTYLTWCHSHMWCMIIYVNVMFDHIVEYNKKVDFYCWKRGKNKLVTYGLFCGATYLYLQFHQSIPCKYYLLLIFITTVSQRWWVMLISDFVTSLYFSFLTRVSMLFLVWMPLAALSNQLHKTGFAMINILELKNLTNKFVVY